MGGDRVTYMYFVFVCLLLTKRTHSRGEEHGWGNGGVFENSTTNGARQRGRGLISVCISVSSTPNRYHFDGSLILFSYILFCFKFFDLFALSIRLLFFASGHSISGRFLPFAVAYCRYFVSHLMFSNRTHSFETLDFFQIWFLFFLPRIEFEFRDLLNALHATIKPLQIMNQCFSVFLPASRLFQQWKFFSIKSFLTLFATFAQIALEIR